MSHIRQQLRDWLKANLAGSTEAGSRVLIRRQLPLQKALQPTLVVSVMAEKSNDISMDGLQQREVTIRVTACVKDDSEAGEDTLDALGVFVEGVFAENPTLGGIAQEYEYQGTEHAFAAEGEVTLCTAAMTFAVAVNSRRDDPETAL